MEYQVTIEEYLARTVQIDATSKFAAEEIVRKMYRNEEIVLDYSDFYYYEINAEVKENPELNHHSEPER